MFEKTLHGANVAACCAVLVTAADVTLAGGLTTGIGAALSVASLTKRADKDMAHDMAKAFDAVIAQNHLREDRLKVAMQMFALFPPSETALAKGDMEPPLIAKNMRAQVKAEAANPSHQTETALNDYAMIINAVVTPLTVPADKNEAMLTELLERSRTSGRTDTLRDEGITEKAIIRLAQRIATDTEDVGQAWLELQNAMDIAVRVQAEGHVQSNHGDFVDTVLARVAELAKDGDYTAAVAEIDAALDQADAQMARLLNSGVEVALLDRDTAKAAALLVRKADIGAGGMAGFEALRTLLIHYYEIGRDKGSNLDSTLAIDLAHQALARTTTPDQRGTAKNDLGAALAILGERESDTNHLDQAVTAYTEALKENTRDRDPLQWAMTQMNLGNALQALGQRESGTDRLDQAVTAYTEALKEHTRDRVPMDWAMTQMNLGNVLATLGQRESDTDRLDQAVTAYSEALKERTRDRVPMQWAMTQMNLGNALLTLGERESGTARLDQAVTAYTEALKEYTRDRVPLEWAMTQMNLGNVLAILGQRESDTDRLDQAVTAYTEALKENTRDRVPLQWAMTQFNLADVELAFFDKTSDPTHLDRATEHVKAAREVFVEAEASRYVMQTDQQLADIQSRRS